MPKVRKPGRERAFNFATSTERAKLVTQYAEREGLTYEQTFDRILDSFFRGKKTLLMNRAAASSSPFEKKAIARFEQLLREEKLGENEKRIRRAILALLGLPADR